jgi:FAD-dependent urate hydroxylase
VHQTHVAIIGAGPHGLSAAAHLGRAGVETTIFGDPMSFWRDHMPKGMLLRSNWGASSIADFEGPLSLDTYCSTTGIRPGLPIPLEDFIDYGIWVHKEAVPDVDRRMVQRVECRDDGFVLTLDDETQMACRRVVVAGGIAPFTVRPDFASGLRPELASHTGDHSDLGKLRGKSVLVVGAGQSATESAALLNEMGSPVELVMRTDHIDWLHGETYRNMTGPLAPLLYAPTGVGPMGIARLAGFPDAFRRLPRRAQDRLSYLAVRPRAADWLADRLAEIPMNFGVTVAGVKPSGKRLEVTLSDGTKRKVDHLLYGTGYKVDVTKYPFLDPALSSALRKVDGYPVLRSGLESSIPGLHFIGAPAVWSFGPAMRFVSGSWFGAASVTADITGRPRRRPVHKEKA